MNDPFTRDVEDNIQKFIALVKKSISLFLPFRCRSEGCLEDLVNDVFVRMYQTTTFDSQAGGIEDWLFIVAKNTTLTHRKDCNRRRLQFVDDIGSERDDDDDDVPDLNGTSVEEWLEIKDQLETILRGLSPHELNLALLVGGGATYEEIATYFHIPLNLVGVRINRLRKKLIKRRNNPVFSKPLPPLAPNV